MKITIELPDHLANGAVAYAADRGVTLAALITESLEATIYPLHCRTARPSWEPLFGALAGSSEIEAVQAVIDDEFSHIDPKAWNMNAGLPSV